MPNDINIMGVYLPPLLVAAVAGLLAASLTANLLNRSGLAARFSNPPLAFIGFLVIYTVIFGRTVFPT
jgi:hypothetical protein